MGSQFYISSQHSNIFAMVYLRQLAVVLVIGVVTAQAERFCPRERREGLECRAAQDKFKCGIFFENLLGDGKIKWIGALPDAIKKTKRTNPELVRKIFPKTSSGNVVTENFFSEDWEDKCDAVDANSKCYSLMNQIARKRLDSCERTVGNLDGKNSIGNELCSQARRFMVSADKDISKGIEDQVLSFYSSTCKNEWKPVKSQDGDLYVSQKLCCDESWNYYSCDGSTLTEC